MNFNRIYRILDGQRLGDTILAVKTIVSSLNNILYERQILITYLFSVSILKYVQYLLHRSILTEVKRLCCSNQAIRLL